MRASAGNVMAKESRAAGKRVVYRGIRIPQSIKAAAKKSLKALSRAMD